MQRPLAGSQTRTVPSSDPEKAAPPPAVNATPKTPPTWPRSTMRQAGGTHCWGRFTHSSHLSGSGGVPFCARAARDTGLSAGSFAACWKDSSGYCPSTDACPSLPRTEPPGKVALLAEGREVTASARPGVVIETRRHLACLGSLGKL